MNNILTPSQAIRYIKALVDEKQVLKDIIIKGEMSNVSYRSSSGHLYFSVGDSTGALRCVMFSRYASSLAKIPKDGVAVIVRGSLNIYEKDGAVQLIAYELQELGQGAQKSNIDEIKKRLAAEGLFSAEKKKALPLYPDVVGVVTSATGAALQDILSTFRTTNVLVKILVYPAVVQGESAPASIIKALERLQADNLCDTCIIARGGGSDEDLGCFNDEKLARAVAAAKVPVISAVGHEVDITLIDLVADARAATPTASVKLATQPISIITDKIQHMHTKIQAQMANKLGEQERHVNRLRLQLRALSPKAKIDAKADKLEYLTQQLHRSEGQKITRLYNRVANMANSLEHLSPMKVLARGYSITTRSDGSIPQSFVVGEDIKTRFGNSTILSTVTSILEDE